MGLRLPHRWLWDVWFADDGLDRPFAPASRVYAGKVVRLADGSPALLGSSTASTAPSSAS